MTTVDRSPWSDSLTDVRVSRRGGWLYRDGTWLRSSSYRGGFVRVDIARVPTRVRGIDRPQYYVQFRRYERQPYARADHEALP